ncbi:AAA family ATPase, partial [Candidatus Gribaldobacteria bacterium]|nr:AAA family ATPase [Candidatus Gribaldobacteria bacterium]
MEKDSVSKIIGSPPGYVGYEEGGQLTEKIRRRPYSVILLDEIEKANPEVFNILLQIFEEGRLTDAKGRLVSFKNTIIIMTSNVGSEYIAELQPLGFSAKKSADLNKKESARKKITDALKDYFKPEFLNRIDETVIFDYLGKTEIKQIVELELQKIKNRLVKAKQIQLDFSQPVFDFLAEKGFDQNLGARPLKRVLQRLVLDPLSLQIITSQIQEGAKVKVELDDKNQLIFKLAQTKQRQIQAICSTA